MEVAVHLDLAALERLPDHLLDGVGLREQFGGWVLVLAVQIVAGQAAAIVTNDDAIGVQHGYDLKDISGAQYFGGRRIAHEELQQAFDDVAGIALAWVHSAG